MAFGWVIDTDHLAKQFGEEGTETDITGEEFGEIPPPGKGRTELCFVLWDDDGERYYSGRYFTDNPDWDGEEESYAVLQWGERFAGCTALRFPGRSELDMS
jgi:hypothetical protein